MPTEKLFFDLFVTTNVQERRRLCARDVLLTRKAVALRLSLRQKKEGRIRADRAS